MTDTNRRPRRPSVTDPQLLRLSTVVDQFAAMDPREREHAIAYVLRRFAATKPADPEPEPAPATPNAPGSDRTM